MSISPKFQYSNDALIFVQTDDGQVHMSFRMDDDTILVFEVNPDNHPVGLYRVYKSITGYKNDISEIDWIMDNIDETFDELDD